MLIYLAEMTEMLLQVIHEERILMIRITILIKDFRVSGDLMEDLFREATSLTRDV